MPEIVDTVISLGVSCPSGDGMKPKDRQAIILEIVATDGEASVDALAARFDVSAETIRRDLRDLASTGALYKVQGGARRIRLSSENSFEERRFEQAEAKAAIARTLGAMIEPGEKVFLDTGTTTLACAEELAQIEGLTVVTNSFRIANRLGAGPAKTRIYAIGGAWAPDNAETVGPMAMQQIASFQADRAIVGVAALDAEAGAMDADFDEAQVAQAMIGHANQVIILAHSEKFDRRAAFRVCRLADIDVLVCDKHPGGELARALEQAGVEVWC